MVLLFVEADLRADAAKSHFVPQNSRSVKKPRK